MKKLISIILVVVFSSQDILSAQSIGNNRMLAPESILAQINSRRDLYGFIETFVLRSCADRLLEKYNANGEIKPTDKEEEIDRWIEIYKRLPNPVKPGKFNHYLRRLIRGLKVEKEDGKVVFTGQIDRKRFRITKRGELSWERIEPVEFIENKGLSERGRLRKSGYAEVKDINDETAKRHELFHIAWWNKLKTDRKVIDDLVRKVSEGELSKVREILGWMNIPAQRVLNEALARIWSKKMAGVGEDELEKVLPKGLLDKVIEVLGLEDVEAIKRLDSSYVDSAIHMPCDMYYIAERNRRAEEERKKREKDEKERKKKEEEEKKRVKRIKEKLEGIGKKLKDKVLNSDELINIYDANFEHDIRETIIKRLGWLGDRGKLKEEGFSVIDDLATALIEGIDEMGGLREGEGRFNEGDRETLKQWFGETDIDELISEMAKSDTFKPIEEKDEEGIKKALETETHEPGVMEFLRELAPDVFGQGTLKSIIWILIIVGISYLLSYIFGWEIGGFVLAMAPIVPTGSGTRDEAKFPSGSGEELKEPSDWIKKYTINLTEKAGELTADSIYLQRKMGEIDRVFRQPEHNNLVLVGDPELANELVENIAMEIARYRKEGSENRLSLSFQNAEILKFNISAILGDLAQFGRYERTMRDLAREIVEAVKKEKRKRYIFYFNFQDIAWIHDQRLDLVADISTLFKSILEETGVPVIGIASEKYYQRFFVDRAENRDMKRYFSMVKLEDLEIADIQILLSKYIRQARERYKDILPPGANIKIDLGETLSRVLRIMNELFPRYNIPVTLLEIMDEVITEKVYRLYNAGLYRENLFNRMVNVMEELRGAKEKGNKELEGFLRGLLVGYNKEWQGLEELEKEVKPNEIEITLQDIAEKISIRKRIPIPVPNANVSIISQDGLLKKTTVTDEKGKYKIPKLPPGWYWIIAFDDYVMGYKKVYINAGSKPANVNIYLYLPKLYLYK